MIISESNQGGVTILKARGRLDAKSAPETDRRVTALIRGGARLLVVDLSGVDYISSAGLRVLLTVAKHVQQAQGKLALAAASPQARQVLDMAGFAAIVPLFDTTAQACAGVTPPVAPEPARQKLLSFAEEIYLLALDDLQGVIKPLPAVGLDYALAGALLMELALDDRIDTDPAALKVMSPEPTGDPLLDGVLRALLRGTEPQTVSAWLKTIAAPAERLPERVLSRLVERGILKQVDQRILWGFAVRRYPMVDDREVKEVRAHLRDLLLGTDIPDPRDVILLSLGKACRLLDDLFTEEELVRAQRRIDALARLDLIGRETADAIREIERAMSFAAMPMM